MKREDLEKIEGLSKEAIDKIMALHGQDIEKHKTAAETAKTELDGVKAQLTEAGKQIEAFKGMNIDQIKASADEWKTKAEKAEADRVAEVSTIRREHALERELGAVKAKNPKAVRALIDEKTIKFNEDGTFVGLKEQLEKIKSENDYLFEGEAGTPHIVAGGTASTSTLTLTMDQIKKMTPAEINKNWPAVQETLAKQKAS